MPIESQDELIEDLKHFANIYFNDGKTKALQFEPNFNWFSDLLDNARETGYFEGRADGFNEGRESAANQY